MKEGILGGSTISRFSFRRLFGYRKSVQDLATDCFVEAIATGGGTHHGAD